MKLENENMNNEENPKLDISDVSESDQFNVGDKVVKNEETWEPNDFDSW